MSKDAKNVPALRFKGFSDAWEKRKLGNISEIRTGPFGSVLHAKDYVNDGVPIITTEHFKSGALPTYKFNLPQVSAEDFRRLKSYNLQPGDVVFSRVGSVDVSAEVLPLQDGWLFSGRVLRVRPKESVSGAFLHYILSTTSIKRNIRSRAVGQTMPSINTKILNDTSIVLPHKTSEQNKISSALASLDSLIAATQGKLDCLERIKKALLQHLFDQSIRFKGYSDPWEKRKLGSVFDYEQPTPYIVNSENYNDQYPTPVLTAGKSLVLGYTDENGGIKLASKHKPVIIFDDFTTSSHLIDFPFKVKSSAMKILSTSSDSDDVYFAFGLLSNLHYEPKNHERHWISQFSAFKVRTPPTTEQKRIGKTLLRIDDLIAATQSKLSNLETLKKALLQGLFI